MLQSGVGVRVAIGKLVYIVLSVKAKGKGHNIVASMVWTSVVVDVFGWKPLPAKATHRHIKKRCNLFHKFQCKYKRRFKLVQVNNVFFS